MSRGCLPRGRILFHDTDTDVTRSRKLATLWVCAAGVLSPALWRASGLAQGMLFWATSAAVMVASLLALVYLLYTKRAGDTFYSCTCIGVCVATLTFTFYAATAGAPSPAVVLLAVLNLVLVGQLGRGATAVVAGLIAIACVVMMLEDAYRFGIYDIPGTAPLDVRMEYHKPCDNPPCAVGLRNAVRHTAVFMVTLALNYWLTRRFVVGMTVEAAAMEHGILVVQDIAQAMSRFDLESARARLDSEQELLRPALHDALLAVVTHLSIHRPYVPQALVGGSPRDGDALPAYPKTSTGSAEWPFAAAAGPDTPLVDSMGDTPIVPAPDSAPHPLAPPVALADNPPQHPHLPTRRHTLSHVLAAVPPPGSTGRDVAVAFTDIRSSTKIWAMCPDGMSRALRMHNAVIRSAMGMFEGYEVKTIGDAFMMAFAEVELAVHCGLRVQEALLQEDWPEALLAVADCHADPDGTWGGLTVRIGVDTGPAEAEVNEITGRYDYFGDVVNRASRLESACPAGAVLGRRCVIEGLSDELGLPPQCYQAGRRVLKGIVGHVDVCAVVPATLHRRFELPHADWVLAAVVQTQYEGRNPTPQLLPLGPQGASMHPARTRSARARAAAKPTAAPPSLSDCQATVMAIGAALPPSFWKWPAGATSAAMNALYESMLHCLAVTGGAVVAGVSDVVLVSWGTGDRNVVHRDAALQFLAKLQRARQRIVAPPDTPLSADSVLGAESLADLLSLPSPGIKPAQDTPPPSVCVGITSGEMMSGAVGTLKQRHVAVVGPNVALAMELMRRARARAIPALYASYTPRFATLSRSAASSGQVHFTEHLELSGDVACAGLSPAPPPPPVYEVRLLDDGNDGGFDALSTHLQYTDSPAFGIMSDEQRSATSHVFSSNLETASRSSMGRSGSGYFASVALDV